MNPEKQINREKGYYPFLAFTSAAWALARFNMAAFSSEVKSLRGVGPGTKFPEAFLAGAGFASAAGASAAGASAASALAGAGLEDFAAASPSFLTRRIEDQTSVVG